jgi:outer membrane murein-binding lipoprotein Lpp
MSRPPSSGAGADASGPHEVQQPNQNGTASRPTRNAPRIFFDDTIPYSANRNSIAAAVAEGEAEAMDGIQSVISATQTTNGTPNTPPPKRKGRPSKRNLTQSSTVAPLVAQLRQGRIDQTNGLQVAVDKIMAAINRQEELAEQRHDELRAQMQELRAENDQLRQELRECKEELNACKETIQRGTNNRATYAEVAVGNESSPHPNQRSPNSPNNSPGTPLNLPGFDLDMTEAYGVHFENATIKDIRERMQQAFKSHAPTQDIGWVGIARRGGSLAKIRICLRTHEDERKARIHTDWINSHFRGARLHGEQWHVVKVDRVSKNAICDASRIRIHEEACARMSAENNVTIRKMHLLGQQSTDKLYCSVAIYLASKDEAENLLRRKFMEVDGEVAYTRPYLQIPTPKRCYHCQKFEQHKAHRCSAQEPVCGVCARPGHTNRECTSGEPKCANCEGPHRASDRGCPIYQRLRREMNATSNA